MAMFNPRLLLLISVFAASTASGGIFSFTQLCSVSIPESSVCTNDSSLSWTAPGRTATIFIPVLDEEGNPYYLDGPHQHQALDVTLGDELGFQQYFDGTASAIATPDTWKLEVAVTFTDYQRQNYVYWPSVDGPFLLTMASANARNTDDITVSGGTGVYSLSYVFSLDGLFSVDHSLLSAGFCAILSLPGTAVVHYSCVTDTSGGVPTEFTLSYDDLPFDAPLVSTLFLYVYGGLSPIQIDSPESDALETVNGTVSAAFGSTIKLQKLVVSDPLGNPIPGLTVSSSSGFAYPVQNGALNPVPEPATVALAGAALAAFGMLRRRA
jgi:hypothetical protein